MVQEVVVRNSFGEASWKDGVFDGPPDVLSRALVAARYSLEVPYGADTFIASSTTPLGAFAALASADPEQTVLVFAPTDVVDAVESSAELGAYDTWGIEGNPHLAMLG